MSGWFSLPRGWRENPVIRKAPRFSEHEAFAWAIEHAAWGPCDARFAGRVVHLERGQLMTSQLEMASIFGWSRKEIRGLCDRWGKAQIWAIRTASAGALITICNYDELQSDGRGKGPTQRPTEGQPRANLLEEEKEEEKKKGNGGAAADDDPASRYAFEGSVIRLTSASLEKWRAAFPNVRNLEGELVARDAWLATQPAKDRGNWFHSTAARLAKLDREMDLAERAEDRAEGSMKRPWIV